VAAQPLLRVPSSVRPRSATGCQHRGNSTLDLNPDGTLNIAGTGLDDSPNAAVSTAEFQDLVLTDGTQLRTRDDTNGGANGRIALFGSDITLTNGSRLVADALQPTAAGNIDIHAADVFTLTNGSVIFANTQDANSPDGDASGSISITADTVDIRNGAQIFNQALGNGNAGGIAIAANDFLLPFGGTLNSGSTGSGNGGNLSIDADNRFYMGSGASTVSAAQSSGDGGSFFLHIGHARY